MVSLVENHGSLGGGSMLIVGQGGEGQDRRVAVQPILWLVAF